MDKVIKPIIPFKPLPFERYNDEEKEKSLIMTYSRYHIPNFVPITGTIQIVNKSSED